MAALKYFPRFLLTNTRKLQELHLVNRTIRLSSTFRYDGKDPAPFFFNNNVQDLLKILTRMDLNKIFRKRRMENRKPPMPVYKFMTEDQLKESIEESKKLAHQLTQMPPVIKAREKIDDIIWEDPALEGALPYKIVFTDITFGVNNAKRLIVVREKNGCLRKADWEIRDRMNQLYFPLKGKEIEVPKMFDDENLKLLLDQHEYEFVLDRACLQFEPNDIKYQDVVGKTYKHIDDFNGYHVVRSTRHFGPLAFFLCWHKMIDNLLLDLLHSSHINEAVALVNLYSIVNQLEIKGEEDNLVENYIKEHSNKKGALELALQSFRELDKGLKAAHEHN